MHALEITVIDRSGTHIGRWAPPPSQQPNAKTVSATTRFDRAAIMRAAWVDYRAAVRRGWTGMGFDRERWTYCLSFAWSLAKAQMIKSDADAKEMIRLQALINAVSAETAPRKLADAIRAELQVIEYSDAFDLPAAHRELALRAELARLMA